MKPERGFRVARVQTRVESSQLEQKADEHKDLLKRRPFIQDVQALVAVVVLRCSQNKLLVEDSPDQTDSSFCRTPRQGHLSTFRTHRSPPVHHSRFPWEVLLRRLRLPLPLSVRCCFCGRLLDHFGHHRVACLTVGIEPQGILLWRTRSTNIKIRIRWTPSEFNNSGQGQQRTDNACDSFKVLWNLTDCFLFFV